MSETAVFHRLEGLEPNNLLAFLSLLGLLRALETSRPVWHTRELPGLSTNHRCAQFSPSPSQRRGTLSVPQQPWALQHSSPLLILERQWI
jgi:hypothetical protein